MYITHNVAVQRRDNSLAPAVKEAEIKSFNPERLVHWHIVSQSDVFCEEAL